MGMSLVSPMSSVSLSHSGTSPVGKMRLEMSHHRGDVPHVP